MKRATSISILAILAIACGAAMADGPQRPTPMTAEQRERMLRETGGPVVTPETGPWIAIINAQDKVDPAFYVKEVEHARNVFRYPLHSTTSTNDWRVAAKAEVAGGAAFAVVVGDLPDEASIVVLPSDQVALVNVAPLASSDADVFNSRFHKEFLRGLAYAFGLGDSTSAISIMKPVRSLEALDALKGTQLGPDSLALSMRLARERGMTLLRKVPYRRAVEEGWAPAPTNEYQRAVWNEIHSKTNAPAAK